VAAWRVGRLRAALPALAAELTAEVDEHLADVPPLAALSDDDLVRVIGNARAELACVHAHEVLAGMLLTPERGTTPAPALALAALAGARANGHADGETIAAEPVVLTLVPPRFGGTAALPASPAAAPGASGGAPSRLDVRDALRVRARWLQELGARAMGELGTRLAAAGRLPAAALVRDVGLGELASLVAGGAPPPDLADRAAQDAGPPLPPQFRLTPGGSAVAVRPAAGRSAGLAAGGGRVVGDVCHRVPLPDGARAPVLVVATLDPGLAAALPSLAGLVAETGSALSHLAILARELGVATVVGLPGARRRLPVGARVLVDGRSGEVQLLTSEGGGEDRDEEVVP
jgi:pyruvate,water dikinase